MSTTAVVLSTLLNGPQHGYEVKRIHDTWFPTGRPLAYGQVYAALARLVKDGSVEVVETRVESGPERTVYALTSRGRERVHQWLTGVDPDPTPQSSDLVRKTVVALRTDSDPRSMLVRQRTSSLRRMHDLHGTPTPDGLARLALDHVIEHLDADLRWLDRALDHLDATSSRSSGGQP